MIFVSAGHHNKDAGAVHNGHKEADWAKKIRNAVCKHLVDIEAQFIVDYDTETLSQYLHRIQTGSGSVVLEFHLDAATNKAARGTTALVANYASYNSQEFARELANITACILGTQNRGVKPEAYSAVGKLGLMREAGIVCLLEVGFITNEADMKALQEPALFNALCLMYAKILKKYDDLIK